MKAQVVRYAGIATLLGLVAILAFGAGRQSGQIRLAPYFPSDDDVERITVLCRAGSDLSATPKIEGVVEYELPAEWVPRILRAFRPAKLAKPESATVDFRRYCDHRATMWIDRTNHQRTNVDIYEYGKEPMRFTVDNELCYRGGEFKNVYGPPQTVYIVESHTIELILRGLSRPSLTGELRKAIDDLLDDLERSAGRLPPIRSE